MLENFNYLKRKDAKMNSNYWLMKKIDFRISIYLEKLVKKLHSLACLKRENHANNYLQTRVLLGVTYLKREELIV